MFDRNFLELKFQEFREFRKKITGILRISGVMEIIAKL
jgi:hypothetical protein